MINCELRRVKLVLPIDCEHHHLTPLLGVSIVNRRFERESVVWHFMVDGEHGF